MEITASPLRQRLKLYAHLVRLDKPIGSLLLLWPTLSALWLASNGRPDWTLVAIFTIGTVLMRSAGCAINDYADRHVDGQVRRTADRPLAAGRLGRDPDVRGHHACQDAEQDQRDPEEEPEHRGAVQRREDQCDARDDADDREEDRPAPRARVAEGRERHDSLHEPEDADETDDDAILSKPDSSIRNILNKKANF